MKSFFCHLNRSDQINANCEINIWIYFSTNNFFFLLFFRLFNFWANMMWEKFVTVQTELIKMNHIQLFKVLHLPHAPGFSFDMEKNITSFVQISIESKI